MQANPELLLTGIPLRNVFDLAREQISLGYR